MTFGCPHGLVLNGPNATTCMGNGEWEPDFEDVKCLGDQEHTITLYRLILLMPNICAFTSQTANIIVITLPTPRMATLLFSYKYTRRSKIDCCLLDCRPEWM